jgi:hypothetical protein
LDSRNQESAQIQFCCHSNLVWSNQKVTQPTEVFPDLFLWSVWLFPPSVWGKERTAVSRVSGVTLFKLIYITSLPILIYSKTTLGFLTLLGSQASRVLGRGGADGIYVVHHVYAGPCPHGPTTSYWTFIYRWKNSSSLSRPLSWPLVPSSFSFLDYSHQSPSHCSLTTEIRIETESEGCCHDRGTAARVGRE